MNKLPPTDNARVIQMPAACPAYWPGARLLAVLAFPPKPGKTQTWQDAEAMFGRNLMLDMMAHDPDWGESEQKLVPRHTLLGASRYDKLSSLVFGKLLNDRMGAAHVAWPLFQEADKLARNLPSHTRHSTSIDRQITRTLQQEHDRTISWASLAFRSNLDSPSTSITLTPEFFGLPCRFSISRWQPPA